MRLVIEGKRIKVVPETDLDVVYIEEALGLREEGDALCLMRHESEDGPRLVAGVCDERKT